MIGQRTARETAPAAGAQQRDGDGDPLAHVRLAVSLATGAGVGLVAGLLGAGAVCALIGWDAAALLYAAWMWATIWRLDARATRRRARREDPGRVLADGLLLGASTASLIAVAGVLIQGGVGFNEPDPPKYSDFAYLAFTVGMTFQVSDTNLESKAMRTTVLRQAWISYVFGAAIIAITINLVAGFTK